MAFHINGKVRLSPSGCRSVHMCSVNKIPRNDCKRIEGVILFQYTHDSYSVRLWLADEVVECKNGDYGQTSPYWTLHDEDLQPIEKEGIAE